MEAKADRIKRDLSLSSNDEKVPAKLLYVLLTNSPLASHSPGGVHLYCLLVFVVDAPIQTHLPAGMLLKLFGNSLQLAHRFT